MVMVYYCGYVSYKNTSDLSYLCQESKNIFTNINKSAILLELAIYSQLN